MKIYEFRVLLPMTVEEYQVAQLYSVAEASKNETGGGEGIEVLRNEPYAGKPLLNGAYDSGQYTLKMFHLASRVPAVIRAVAPTGSLDIQEEAWNAYPYCRTIVTNPGYMKDAFHVKIETLHAQDGGTQVNAHNLNQKQLVERKVITIDIANDPVAASDYKPDEDPTKYRSEKAGRGPLAKDWSKTTTPIMCAYKLVTCEFRWFGLQGKIEDFIMTTERRIFTNFHRQVFCWMDRWFGFSMEDIRAIEAKTKEELDEKRRKGSVRGTKADE